MLVLSGEPQEVEKHLLISIGDQVCHAGTVYTSCVKNILQIEQFLATAKIKWSYLALPKGGLISEHVLILPIGHYGASTDAPEACKTDCGLPYWGKGEGVHSFESMARP
eukprot:Em0017g198a